MLCELWLSVWKNMFIYLSLGLSFPTCCFSSAGYQNESCERKNYRDGHARRHFPRGMYMTRAASEFCENDVVLSFTIHVARLYDGSERLVGRSIILLAFSRSLVAKTSNSVHLYKLSLRLPIFWFCNLFCCKSNMPLFGNIVGNIVLFLHFF